MSDVVVVAVIAAGVRLATPYLLAGLGETIGQRSGVLNLGVDGVMQISAFVAYFAVLNDASLVVGVGLAALTGLLMGVGYGVITVIFKATQGISGIGIFIFGLGLSSLFFQEYVGTPKPSRQLPTFEVPLLSDIPVVGDAIFSHNPLTFLAFGLIPLVMFLVRGTTFGMNIRAVGENPEAADSLGVSVARTRFLAILIGNTLAGLAGAALVLQLGIFQPNLTQGMGFIAVALVYFGSWRPLGVMAGALLYGLVTAIVLQFKATGVIPVEGSDLAAMAPAVLTIVALVVLARKERGPAALAQPFQRQ